MWSRWLIAILLAAAAARIYRALGPGSIEMLQTDPYATTEVEVGLDARGRSVVRRMHCEAPLLVRVAGTDSSRNVVTSVVEVEFCVLPLPVVIFALVTDLSGKPSTFTISAESSSSPQRVQRPFCLASRRSV